MKKVTLLPSHPAEGYLSMLRYWRLAHELLTCPESKIEVSSLLNSSKSTVRKPQGRFLRAFHKYVSYPACVKLSDLGDLVHVLDHSSAHLLKYISSNVKKVVTVHDIIPLYSNDEMASHQILRFRKLLSHLNDADLIIAVSDYTRNDLIKKLGIDGSKIRTSLLGVRVSDFLLSENSAQGKKDEEPTIISVGGNLERKNLSIFPELIANVKKVIPNIRFWRVGDKMLPEVAEPLSRLLGSNFVEHGRVSDQKLAELYSKADALVFPSHYEGFGLPLLEAMAAGCPVVSSNQSSLPEVGLDSALYFDPSNVDEATEQLLKVLQSEELRSELREKGRARVEELNWQRHFDEVHSWYAELLES